MIHFSCKSFREIKDLRGDNLFWYVLHIFNQMKHMMCEKIYTESRFSKTKLFPGTQKRRWKFPLLLHVPLNKPV